MAYIIKASDVISLIRKLETVINTVDYNLHEYELIISKLRKLNRIMDSEYKKTSSYNTSGSLKFDIDDNIYVINSKGEKIKQVNLGDKIMCYISEDCCTYKWKLGIVSNGKHFLGTYLATDNYKPYLFSVTMVRVPEQKKQV